MKTSFNPLFSSKIRNKKSRPSSFQTPAAKQRQAPAT